MRIKILTRLYALITLNKSLVHNSCCEQCWWEGLTQGGMLHDILFDALQRQVAPSSVKLVLPSIYPHFVRWFFTSLKLFSCLQNISSSMGCARLHYDQYAGALWLWNEPGTFSVLKWVTFLVMKDSTQKCGSHTGFGVLPSSNSRWSAWRSISKSRKKEERWLIMGSIHASGT